MNISYHKDVVDHFFYHRKLSEIGQVQKVHSTINPKVLCSKHKLQVRCFGHMKSCIHEMRGDSRATN